MKVAPEHLLSITEFGFDAEYQAHWKTVMTKIGADDIRMDYTVSLRDGFVRNRLRDKEKIPVSKISKSV